jgi:tRNA A-37 threonylcarbamoyl transferase component Bud32
MCAARFGYARKDPAIAPCAHCATPLPEGATACPSCGIDVLVGGTAGDGPFARGTVLESRYRIDTEVGRGGMGIVYRGTDLTLKRPVAIKALRQVDADNTVLSRFLREARSLARVEHPGLVPVYAVGREDGTYYMVMKFVEGETLQSLIKRSGALEPRQIRRVMRETCEALGALHKHGLIHRDLKPGNIMLSAEGRVVVMDLGIVKAVGENTQTTSTALGTPKYMAPETLTDTQVDPRADLYSLGVIGYEMLTGDPPFDGPTPMAILFKQAHEPPEPLRKRAPNAPRNLASAVERALSKLPTDRFESAAEMALAVEEDKPVDLPVHIRGSHLNLAKEPVPRGFIQVANRAAATTPPKDHSGRLELAGWLTSPDNPLTARVIVNRIWQAHFGEGLVRTPDNFGLRGETPSHPELLDWLAREFLRSGWDVKHLHRLILGSATWQQASEMRNAEFGMRNETARVGAQPIQQSAFSNPHSEDPDNRLLAHFPRQRLEAEMVRDALLAVSGRLEATSGGTLVNWKNDDYTPTDDVSAASTRRSVYLPIVRDRVFDVFTIFDFANPSVGTSKRNPTVVSHQALFFLNSPLVKASARALAETLLAELPHDQDARIRLAYERAFGRPPTEPELRRSVRFIASATRGAGLESDISAWTAWCQALFAANEFLYRE